MAKRRSNRQLLIKKLDVLARTLVKLRDNYTCQKCHKVVQGTNCHASHVIPVSAGSKLRWDIRNMKVLCMHCHFSWWHLEPTESGKWFKEKFPDRWEYLENTRGLKKFEVWELEEMYTDLKQKVDAYGNP